MLPLPIKHRTGFIDHAGRWLRARSVLLFLLVLPAAGLAQKVVPLLGAAQCGGFPRGDNGPYDYRHVRDGRLKIVEQFHFTPNVEALTSGNSSAYVGAELNFTLRAFPNHHRALVAAARLAEKMNAPMPPGMTYPVECWLERAVRFAPTDPVARMIYATYLHKHAHPDEALAQMQQAVVDAGDNPFTHYNAGLVYLDMAKFDLALKQAHTAYGMGFQRPDLREKLRLAGRWQDAAADAAVPGASAASN